jgi:hypothetical protein
MKYIIKNGYVIESQPDNSLAFFGGDLQIRYLLDNFIYDTPILETIISYSKSIEISRTYIKNGDLDPLYNSVNISLENRKLIAYMTLSKECENFIYYKSNGDTRYPQYKQTTFTDISIVSKEFLIENPTATPEEKAPYESRIVAVNNVRAWIKTVLDYYYSILNNSRNTTEETWSSLTWDFTQFEASDPDVWLENIKL